MESYLYLKFHYVKCKDVVMSILLTEKKIYFVFLTNKIEVVQCDGGDSTIS